MKHIVKDSLHCSLICCFDILHTKRRWFIAEDTFGCEKSYDFLIFYHHLNLIIYCSAIHTELGFAQWRVTGSHPLVTRHWDLEILRRCEVVGSCFLQGKFLLFMSSILPHEWIPPGWVGWHLFNFRYWLCPKALFRLFLGWNILHDGQAMDSNFWI